MSIEVEKIQFQTEAEAQKVRESQKQDLVELAVKYKMSVKELIEAAKNDEIDDTDDLFLIFNRSYLFSTNQ
ncbi:MAG: hypothetical protein Q7U04_01890 [Bacteriovorax sp.]|jgi:hypothetical protein|nr:hypothetical protein [Bacteriovorax sp.]